MTLNKFVQIDSRFEKSVNLTLDLQDPSKLVGYIPTTSSLKLIEAVFRETLSMSDKRASLLVGPYGKGKSHLLLVVLSFLARINSEQLEELKSRMAEISPEIEQAISEVEKQGPFLPVIINPTEGTLSQAFFKGLMKSLREAGLDEIVPDSYYTEAIRTIKAWKQEFPATYNAFCRAMKDDASDIVRKLEKCDEDELSKFREIYPSLTSGAAFNPLVEDDIIAVYRSVNRSLRTKKGYSGMYIVFDEFSKYIEGHGEVGFASDMKTLQDICELALSSKEEQLHITCIAHKSINAYNKTIRPEFVNAFEGVSGRLSEIYFTVSSKNNYELIADAIKKKESFAGIAAENEHFKKVAHDSYKLSVFSSLFTEEDFWSIVAEGCYPLTPISSMILLELCEKIAQNERTIFTYLTSRDRSSLAQVIKRTDAGSFVGVDSVYDYFADIFKGDTTYIHHEWLKAEYALSKANSEDEKMLIKAIALIRMVGKEELRANDAVLSAALAFDADTFKETSKSLCASNLIVFKRRSQSYEFKNNIGVDLEAAINDAIIKHFSKADTSEVLNRVCREKNILPKKHNQEFKITRYFNVSFCSFDQFMLINDTSYLRTSHMPDGFVVFILPGNIKVKAIKDHLKELGASNLAVVLPETEKGISRKAQELLAIDKLLSSDEFTDNSPVLIKELANLRDDYVFEINEWINASYYSAKHYYCWDGRRIIPPEGLNRVVSDLCDLTYAKSPIINHELINRQVVSAQIAKARNNIIDTILSDRDTSIYKNGTSAEATIFRAIFTEDATLDRSWNEIEDIFAAFFTDSVGRKHSFSHLIDAITCPPYGLRRGPLPIIISHEMAKRHGTPVIYLNDKELLLNEEAIINAVKKPADYYLYIEESSAAKDEYIAALCDLFEEYSIYCKDVDSKNKLSKTVCLMQTWYRSLPQASITFSKSDDADESFEKVLAFRKIFSNYFLNPRDVLFDSIPAVFGVTDYSELIKAVGNAKAIINNHIVLLKDKVVGVMRDKLGYAQNVDLHEALNEWFEKLPKETKSSIFSGITGNVINVFKEGVPADRELIASKFAKAVTGIFIEDWSETTITQFEEGFSIAMDEIANRQNSISGSKKFSFVSEEGEEKECLIDFDPQALSVSGTFLQNALLDALDEFGDVIDEQEKIGILMDIASKLIK